MSDDKILMQTPRGTHDRLPEDETAWRFVYRALEKRADGFGYSQIVTPTFEHAQIYIRALGEKTDIVEKEMFEVRRATQESDDSEKTKNDSYILRPEGTAGIIRAYREHGMHTWQQPVKLWYFGSMFRAERPQKGRYREHWQAGFEVIGDGDPATDALVIYVGWQFFSDLGIKDKIVVDINSVGCPTCRVKYKKNLIAHYHAFRNEICVNCARRLESNPIRLLDCKEEKCNKVKERAPQILDQLCTNCREHFRVVLESLDELGVRYDLNPYLVRGLDYYTRTTFEFRITHDDKRQNSLGGGGRYDGFVELFGGSPTPGLGFGLGIDRIVETIKDLNIAIPSKPLPDVFLIQLGEHAKKACFSLVSQLGEQGLSAICHPGKDGLKNQLSLADRAGVRFAVIIGQRETIDETAILRDMSEATQETITQKDLSEILKKKLVSA